ncbi:acyl-CoA N-acyltransferase [Cladochytrium replicatum]|nr:acyl-CoA N-acyltransferase [Cladochytrium replicatum]
MVQQDEITTDFTGTPSAPHSVSMKVTDYAPVPTHAATDPYWEWVQVGPQRAYLLRRNRQVVDSIDRYFRRPPPGATIISSVVELPARSGDPSGSAPRLGMMSMQVFDVENPLHVDTLHRWMNLSRVAEFWKEEGPKSHQEGYIRSLPWHSTPLLVMLNGEPLGYLEAYWAVPDRISAYHKPETYDRGFHVLVGEDHLRGFLTVWFAVLAQWIFLDDARTTKIYAEPRIDNVKFIQTLERMGFERLGPGEIQMPHKRAALLGFRRETYDKLVAAGLVPL